MKQQNLAMELTETETLNMFSLHWVDFFSPTSRIVASFYVLFHYR